MKGAQPASKKIRHHAKPAGGARPDRQAACRRHSGIAARFLTQALPCCAPEPAADNEDFEAGPSDEEPSSSGGGESESGSELGSDEQAGSSDSEAEGEAEGDDEDWSGGHSLAGDGWECVTHASPEGRAASAYWLGCSALLPPPLAPPTDDGVDDGMPAEGGGEEGEGEDDSEGGGGSGSEGEGPAAQHGGGFLAGGKDASFAKAFAKIMDTSGKKAAEATAAAPAAAAAPILAASKSIAKRKAEDAEEAAASREAKKLRQEMKQRGHEVPARRGQDPAADVKEKALQRLATKGVVRLFNAIAKAQKQLREAEEATGSRAKAVKLGKASFLSALKRSAEGEPREQPLVPSAPTQRAAATVGTAAGSGKQQQGQRRGAAAQGGSSSEDEDATGWEVLQRGFVGLQGGSKMKDWDKAGDSGEEDAAEQLVSSEDDDE